MKKIICALVLVFNGVIVYSQPYTTQYSSPTSGSLTGTGYLRVNTQYGYLDLGPQAANWCQFNTDRDRFYFNKNVFIQTGTLSAYSTNNLTLATSTAMTNPVQLNPRLTILNGNGFVGIGTTNPLGQLHVLGNLSVFSSNSTPTFSAAIRGNSSNSISSTPDFTWYNDDQTGIYHPAPGVIGFTNYGTQNMRIDDFGRVVIGGAGVTNLPAGYKLYVASGIYAEQVRIATYPNWADYVFDEKYKLMSLDSLNQYIQKNKHLPNIPSAEEVSEEGINLADMDSKLLEKIEELTLYLIELNKKVESLEKENENLKLMISK